MRIAFALLAAALLTAHGARADDRDRPRLRIGSKRFTESYILAEIAAATARRSGPPNIEVTHAQGLGGTALVYRALKEGSIDVYPEYTGTIAEAVLHVPGRADVPSLRRALGQEGIGITDPLGFENTYGIAVPAKLALGRHLETISDLAAAAGMKLGFSHEFLGRSDGFPALAARYGIASAEVQALDHGLAYEAIARGAIDVTDVYSTDAQIERYKLKVLADDRGFFPSYQAVFLYREDAARRAPAAIRAIAALSGAIDNPTMIGLNARAELDGQEFASVADAFLRAQSGHRAAIPQLRPSLVRGILETVRTEGPRHVRLVALSVFLATFVGIPLGIWACWTRTVGRFVLAATSIVQTIPSLALLCFFIPLFGTGAVAALAALFLYALLPITRNTVAGLDAIPPALRESAAALGLGRWSQLLRVELPLASRTILAGIRTSAVISVGTATLAAFIGAGGFGAPISTGLDLDDTRMILEGAIPAALLALAVEGLFALLDRTIIPEGLRPRAVARVGE
ncbi:MAG TPA: glycine betaine ABC transporter substrate-binding protein [Polyangiaceae bacterium]|nr:glycine betaine ABC transporter substrate-binding protein [Polyangiaceae bacterium]